MAFKELDLKELVRTADEDFAFELSEEERGSKKLALAAFAEAKLKFKDYLLANPDQAEKFAKKEEIPVVETFTGGEINSVVVEQPPIVVAQQPISTGAPWLIRMDRKNPLYEIGKYRWTRDHPYALVAEDDVEAVLNVDGFRQAKPSEVTEFYG